MRAQLEQRLVELRAEYETGQNILKNIEAKLAELENKKNDLNETLLRISGAIELLEEILKVESESSILELKDTELKSTELQETELQSTELQGKELQEKELQGAESEVNEVEVPFVIRLPLEHAIEKLEEAGLHVGNVGEKSVFVGGVRFGDVVQQEPKGGTRAKKGSTVDLIVAKKGNLKPDLSQNSLLCPYSRH